MSERADTLNEFVRSYERSWVGMRGENGRVYPARINFGAFDASTGVLKLKRISDPDKPEEESELVWKQDRMTLVRDMPDLGMISLGPTIGYLSTKPARHWHKGYYPNNVLLHIHNLPDISAVEKLATFHTKLPKVLWQVYNREYWHPKEAIRLIEEGEGVGYPLSKHFGVYLQKDVEHPLIAYKKELAGVYSKEGNWVFLDRFKPCVEQFKRETNVEAY